MKFQINKQSQDIKIPTWNKNKVLEATNIHVTDTISIILGCSLHPIVLNLGGILLLFDILARVEERLNGILLDANNACTDNNAIPNYLSWIVPMVHINQDSLMEYDGKPFNLVKPIEYSGELFGNTLEQLRNVLVRAYSKDFGKNKRRIRLERQEYPKASRRLNN